MVEKLTEGTSRTVRVDVVHAADDRVEFTVANREMEAPRKGRAPLFFGLLAVIIGVVAAFIAISPGGSRRPDINPETALSTMIISSVIATLCFVIAAVLQVMFSMTLVVSSPSRALLWVGVIGNGLVMVLWLITRTLGVPMGPMAGEILPIGLLDGLAQILEVAQILHLAVLLRVFGRLGNRPLVE